MSWRIYHEYSFNHEIYREYLKSLKGWILPGPMQLSGLLTVVSLQWHHNERDGVSNHQPPDCLRNRLFRPISKKTSKLRVTGLCEGNSPVTGEFPAQRASNTENVSIWWRHHVMLESVVVGWRNPEVHEGQLIGRKIGPGAEDVKTHKVIYVRRFLMDDVLLSGRLLLLSVLIILEPVWETKSFK